MEPSQGWVPFCVLTGVWVGVYAVTRDGPTPHVSSYERVLDLPEFSILRLVELVHTSGDPSPFVGVLRISRIGSKLPPCGGKLICWSSPYAANARRSLAVTRCNRSALYRPLPLPAVPMLCLPPRLPPHCCLHLAWRTATCAFCRRIALASASASRSNASRCRFMVWLSLASLPTYNYRAEILEF